MIIFVQRLDDYTYFFPFLNNRKKTAIRDLFSIKVHHKNSAMEIFNSEKPYKLYLMNAKQR